MSLWYKTMWLRNLDVYYFRWNLAAMRTIYNINLTIVDTLQMHGSRRYTVFYIMRLVFLCLAIITMVIPTSYGDKCTTWNRIPASFPLGLIETVMKHIREYNPIETTNQDTFNIKSVIEDYNRGLQAEDRHWNFTQLIEKHGYQVEQHDVTTSDGYILGVFHIPGNGPVVFLQHELFGSSDDYVTAGKGHALAYELTEAGYDLWFGNARGNVHSRRHIKLSPDCKEFWDFSWDEIGRRDLPAMIDYVLEKTNKKNLQYIGYSQGTTSFFVMCSEKPEYNEKISIMIALAPVAWVSHSTNVLFRAVGLFDNLLPKSAALFENLFGYELLPRNKVTNAITDIACGTPVTAEIFCNNIVSRAFGFDYAQINSTYLPRVYAHVPVGISSKQLLHYGQGVYSGKFRRYDHGVTQNLKKYRTASPPDYPVHKITTRVVIFQGYSDNTATNEDVAILVKKLPNFNKADYYEVPLKSFSHFDFITANDVKALVHNKILEFLHK